MNIALNIGGFFLILALIVFALRMLPFLLGALFNLVFWAIGGLFHGLFAIPKMLFRRRDAFQDDPNADLGLSELVGEDPVPTDATEASVVRHYAPRSGQQDYA
jgi:hypothetical protein